VVPSNAGQRIQASVTTPVPFHPVFARPILPPKAKLSSTTCQHLSSGEFPVHTRRLADAETSRPNTGAQMPSLILPTPWLASARERVAGRLDKLNDLE
jgi:hypothetical protein